VYRVAPHVSDCFTVRKIIVGRFHGFSFHHFLALRPRLSQDVFPLSVNRTMSALRTLLVSYARFYRLCITLGLAMRSLASYSVHNLRALYIG